MVKLQGLKIDNLENVISLAIFGSYETEFWKENTSDIDILVLMKRRESIEDELDLEDEILPKLSEYFDYENIHITFITMKDFDTVFAKKYLESRNKLILDELLEIDFRLYVNKYQRENKWLDTLIEQDTKLMEDENGSLL